MLIRLFLYEWKANSYQKYQKEPDAVLVFRWEQFNQYNQKAVLFEVIKISSYITANVFATIIKNESTLNFLSNLKLHTREAFPINNANPLFTTILYLITVLSEK